MPEWGCAVVIAHPEPMVAEAIAAALARNSRIVPTAVATDSNAAERAATEAGAVALARHLPGAAKAAARLRAHGKRVVFIGEQAHEDDGVCVSTDDSVQDLARALVPGLVREPSSLSPREQQVLDLVAAGLATKQVARQLAISPKTVEQHKARIYSKLGVPNQAAAVGVAGSRGWLTAHASDPKAEIA